MWQDKNTHAERGISNKDNSKTYWWLFDLFHNMHNNTNNNNSNNNNFNNRVPTNDGYNYRKQKYFIIDRFISKDRKNFRLVIALIVNH